MKRKIIRQVYGPVNKQGIWRVRGNLEISDILKLRLRWKEKEYQRVPCKENWRRGKPKRKLEEFGTAKRYMKGNFERSQRSSGAVEPRKKQN